MKKLFTLFSGILSVALVFGQTQRMVLFEEFIGENCPPCAAIKPDVDAAVDAYTSEVIYMQYLTDIPSPGALYYLNPGDVNSRRGYYGFNVAPSGVQDGVQWDSSQIAPPASNSPWYNPDQWAINDNIYIPNEYGVPSPFTLDVSHVFSLAGDSFYATVNISAAENFTASGSLRLQVAMVEDMQFQYSPGNNGVTNFPHAVRKMYPGPTGTTLSSNWTSGQTKTITIGAKVPAFIRDKSKVTFIAFIQDNGNKHVQQAAISMPYTFDIDVQAASVQGNFGNCYNSQYTPVVNVNNIGNQQVFTFNVIEYLDGAFVDSVAWNGNLASSNSAAVALPAMSIPQGTHTLKLVLSTPNYVNDPNQANNSASITLDMPVPAVSMPLVEGFESGSGNWAVEAPTHDSTWRVVNAGDASSYSFMMDYFDNLFGDFVGPIDNLYSPPLDLTYAAHATIKFAFANQMINFGNGYGVDSLHIDVSGDCGNTWQTVYSNGGSTLATGGSQLYNNTLHAFAPTANQWKQDSADISIVANRPNVLLRFRSEGYDGNNLYIDNINITKYDSIPYTGIDNPLSSIQSANVYPNPANTQITVELALDKATEVSCTITDITGKAVANFPAEAKNPGRNAFTISTTSLSEGIYFVTVLSGADRISKKIAVMH